MVIALMKYSFIFSMLCVLTACSSARLLSDPDYSPPKPMAAKPKNSINGSIYAASTNVYLFEDIRARRVGDSLTVILQEQTNASKSASTSAKKESDLTVPSVTALGRTVTRDGVEVLTTDLESDSEFSGEGDSSQSNSLTGDITVTIVDVLANGNLIIKGEKLLTLNQGSEVVRISGIVRSIDITPENTVKSTQIANASITYSGNGIVGNSNRPGWATRFFHSVFWPF